MGLMELADVFFCNAAEAAHITGRSDVREAAEALAGHARVAVVKAGASGAIAVSQDEVVEVPAPPMEPVDTVGAGDSFDAGFLLRWIAGQPLPECLRFAVACGSLSTRGVGGTSRQATAQEAGALAEELRVNA
jgi:sugar/nucleoside kinase (ribokinase family)